jgi:hypothetical protein
MGLMDQIQGGMQQAPPRITIYGQEGVGKSTLAACAPKPIFIRTEDGLAQITCDKFPLAKSLGDVLQALAELRTTEHPYQTVVVDTLDWLERLIHAQVCQDFGPVKYDSIEKVDGGYQRGYMHALTHWRKVLDGLDALRREKGLACLLIAHAKFEKYELPGESAVDRYSPRLNKHAGALVCEWSDAVLFATWKMSPTKIRQEQNERILRTVCGPHCVAKNRFNLSPEIPLSWPAVMAGLIASPNPTEGVQHNG